MKSIAIKLTNRCNLNCKHCYNYNCNSLNLDMQLHVIDASIEYIKNKISKYKNENFLITFIGGEVCIFSTEKMQYILDKLQSYTNVTYMIATNLLYKITDLHLSIFNNCDLNKINKLANDKKHIEIRTSWDYNIRFKSVELEQLFFDNCKLLITNNINPVVITTLTSELISNIKPFELFKKYASIGISNITLEPLVNAGNLLNNSYLIPKNNDLDKWLVEAYKAAKYFNIDDEEFVELEHAIKNNSTIQLCSLLTDEETIDVDGSISFLKFENSTPFGNVFGQFNKDIYTKYSNCIHYNSNVCILCKYYKKFCNGPCKMHKFDETGCPGHKLLLDYVVKTLNK